MVVKGDPEPTDIFSGCGEAEGKPLRRGKDEGTKAHKVSSQRDRSPAVWVSRNRR